MPGTVLSMQNIDLVKKNYANPPEGDTKPPEDSASMKFVYHQLNYYPTESVLSLVLILSAFSALSKNVNKSKLKLLDTDQLSD